MKILVYGAGILGCQLASALCRGKAHVTLLARGSWKETIDQRGLTVRHALQLHTTRDRIPTVDHLEPHWAFDLIFVVLQAGQLPSALPELAENRSRHIVFVGNNPDPEETQRQLLASASTEKEIAFGFLAAAGRRDGVRVVGFHKGLRLTVGELGQPLSEKFTKLLERAARHTPLRYRPEAEMGVWLRSHLTLILPLCYAIYARNGHMKQISPEQQRLCLDAAGEGCRLLTDLGVPLRAEDGEDWFSSGWKRKTMEWMMLLLVRTPLGPLCAGDHAMKAVPEMQFLDRAFQQLRQQSALEMPAWETLRRDALHLLEPPHHHHHGHRP